MSLNRPLSVAIIGWMLLVFSVLGLGLMGYLIASVNLDQGQFVGVLIQFGFGSLCLMMLALGIFKGANWARILLLWSAPASIVLSFVGKGPIPETIIGTGIYIGFVFFLNQSAATDYFRKDARKDRFAYIAVVVLIALTVLGTFAPKIMRWAVETYRIGYVRQDIGSLKLPADWKEVSALRPAQSEWNALYPGTLPEIAWGGLVASERLQLDIETGARTTVSNKDAFVFQPGYLREDGTLFPCGLARYQLTFPDTVNDPLRKVLNSQFIFSYGSVRKHQYLREAGFRVVEFDIEVKGYRFFVWNWWQSQEPHKVYGMILGAPAKSIQLEDICGVANSAGSFELERTDGWKWKATDINKRINPAMTQVDGMSIEMDIGRFRRFGIDAEMFFSWLKNQTDTSLPRSGETLQNLLLPMVGEQNVKLADVAKVYRIGRGKPDATAPWPLLLVQLNYDCSKSKNDVPLIKAALESELSIRLNCR